MRCSGSCDKKARSLDRTASVDLAIPILEICYGMQLVSLTKGGQVRKYPKGEYGQQRIKPLSKNKLLTGIKDKSRVWMSHKDVVIKVPKGFKVIGCTNTIPIAASTIYNNIYGVQFHPEVTPYRAGETYF